MNYQKKQKKVFLKKVLKVNSDLDTIKHLREITGAGFLDCKKALVENNNNIETSIDYLRKKGLSKASKKVNREAKEGAIGVYANKDYSIILKINSETDFAAKSDKFLKFMDDIGQMSLSFDEELNINNFLDKSFDNKKISEYFNEIISIIGENILLGDLVKINHNKYNMKYYVHNPYKNNIGKIISLIIFDSDEIDENIDQFSKNICMHIAASKPDALDINLLDKELVAKEKEFQIENIKSSGKPENIIEKILEGKMKKFYSESTLLNQQYVIDPDKTVKEVINNFSKQCKFQLIDYKLIMIN